MIAIDTNLLVYAHRAESVWNEPAKAAIGALAVSPAAWAIPWPCLHEFLAVVTHPKIFAPPTPLSRAIAQVEIWLESPSLVLLSEPAGHFKALSKLLHAGRITGPRVHDARIAALCSEHGVRELWTADRDFTRFPGLYARNPLVG